VTEEQNISQSEEILVAPSFRPFTIEISHRDRVCYALAYNKIPFVNNIRVTNSLGGVSSQITILVDLEWTASERDPMKRRIFVEATPPVGDILEIDGTDFRLEDSALVDLEETTHARLVVTVDDGAGIRQTEETDITILARNQWINSSEIHSSLAAFVQPNHPTVNEILAEASGVLRTEGKQGSLEGYQAGPERAREIGRAVFMALQRRIDRYVDIPASFDDEGQKVRPLDDVLEHRQGTCIDLACAYASCLEQAGLHPVICIVHGHAFSGFFLNERGDEFPSVMHNFATMINLVESGEVILAETVDLTGEGSFDGARANVRSHLRETIIDGCQRCETLLASGRADADPHLRAFINVLKCHKEGVLPLPARVVRDGIVTIVIDNGPSEAPVLERRDEKTGGLLPNSVPARVQQWKNALLDLSFRNRLLNYKPDSTGIALFTPLDGIGSIEDRLSQGQPILVRPSDDVTEFMRERGFMDLADEVRQRGFRAVQAQFERELKNEWERSATLWGMTSSGSFANRIKKLVATAKDEEQETGVNNLYMTFGTLKWNDPKSSVGSVTSPIFMTPIRIAIRRGHPVPTITMDDAAMTTINYCLVEALRSRRGLRLDWFSQDMSDLHGLDIGRGLQELRREILDERLSDQGFEVIDDASIGVLRFNKIRLWKDLNDHWELFMRNSVVRHLIVNGRSSLFSDPNDPDGMGIPPIEDAELMNPQPADGAQSRAIKRALAGHTFVLEGPPGTGKSQTITNLLANALAQGKRVLFVAEKPAALEVVKERLQEVGLDPFCLDMHDKGSKPEDLKKQLRDALAFTPSADMEKWNELDAKFRLVAQVLCVYRDKIHGPARNGRSFYDAYTRLLELGDGPVATSDRSLYEVPHAEIEVWRTVLGGLGPFAEVARPRPGHPWMLAGAIEAEDVPRAELAETILSLLTSSQGLSTSTDEWSMLAAEMGHLFELVGLVAMMQLTILGVRPPANGWREVMSPGWISEIDQNLVKIQDEMAACVDLSQSLGHEFLEMDLAPMLSAVRSAASSFVIGRKGRLKKALGRYAAVTPFVDAELTEVVRIIERMKSAADSVRASAELIRSRASWLLPHDWTPVGNNGLEEAHRRLSLVSDSERFVAGMSGAASRAIELQDSGISPKMATVDCASGLLQGYSHIKTIVGATDESIALWSSGRPELKALAEVLPEWSADGESSVFRTLTRWLAFSAQVALVAGDCLVDFRRELLEGVIPAESSLMAFDRALMSVTLTVVGQEHDLDVFDHAVHNRRVNEFVNLLKERELLLRRIIPFLLHASREFDSNATTGEVGELKAELVARKRGARSIRHLLAKFPDLISSLAPCFLMSPDSIAKFLEPGKLEFDLIVFDEASQIPVSCAAGALGRAEAAVVVGDSKQMPPTSVAEVAPVREPAAAQQPAADETPVPEDEESILDECVGAGMQREWLEWHYRSRDEVLIKFSNDKYYDGRLSSFPAPFLQVPGCGIEYHRVNGSYESGGSKTNSIEADAIVAEVKRRANDPVLRRFSIGIVTMNLEQRELILKKLGELNDPAVMALIEKEDDQESLFVLNLESVQGRERDVIILGTSFSRPADGSQMSLNFGPLTLTGGERRLNVAITRARRTMVIFSSFDPEDMNHAKSVGMRHLRDYLGMAKAISEGSRPQSTVSELESNDMHRHVVADALRERGLIVEVGLGLSTFKVDIAVTLPGFEGRWLVGVLLDGKVWAARPLALDRDALPRTVLEKAMGWRSIARVWLPSWKLDAKEIVEDIYREAVRVSLEPVDVPTTLELPPIPELETIVDETEDEETGTEAVVGLPNERPFVPAESPGLLGSVADLEPPAHRAKETFERIIETSGPMALEAAIRMTAGAFGLSRVRDTRLAELELLADESRLSRTEFGVFAYPATLIDAGEVSRDFVWHRRSTFSERVVQDIAPHEMANLFRDITRVSRSIEPAELANVALTAVGYSRKTTDTVAYVLKVIQWTVSVGLLVERQGRLVVED
jgi:hypothetical protein